MTDSAAPQPKTTPLRADRYLTSQGLASRKAATIAIKKGKLWVENVQIKDPKLKIGAFDGQKFSFDGEESTYSTHIYFVLNKPTDSETSHKPKHHPSVFALFEQHLQNRELHAAGRLDADTTGLLLISDDGHFIHHVSSPKHKVAKIYRITTDSPVTDDLITAITTGVKLNDEDQLTKADDAVAIDTHTLTMTLTEGKYHQVKRMIAAAGNHVCALERTHIGPLTIDIPQGQYRALTPAELKSLGYTIC